MSLTTTGAFQWSIRPFSGAEEYSFNGGYKYVVLYPGTPLSLFGTSRTVLLLVYSPRNLRLIRVWLSTKMITHEAQLSPAKICIGLCLVFVFQLIVRRWLAGGTLNKVPGPQIAKFTNLRLKFAVLSGDRVHYVHDLHSRYGPIVRIGPNEVAVADMDATKAIHKINSGFTKSPWYQILNKSEHPGIFAMTNVRDHATRRRLLAQSFSKSNLMKWEQLVREKTDLTIARISSEVTQQGQSDILKWFTFMATDLIGQLSFGDSFRMLEIGQVSLNPLFSECFLQNSC